MNKQLELFLNHCKLLWVHDGGLVYEILDLWGVFDKMQRYADNAPRCEESELIGLIIVDKKGGVTCELQICDEILDQSPPFRIVNATLENIEKWFLQANTDALKPYNEESSQNHE